MIIFLLSTVLHAESLGQVLALRESNQGCSWVQYDLMSNKMRTIQKTEQCPTKFDVIDGENTIVAPYNATKGVWGDPSQSLKTYDIGDMVGGLGQNIFRMKNGMLEILHLELRAQDDSPLISSVDCIETGVFRAHHIIQTDTGWEKKYSSESFVSNIHFDFYPSKNGAAIAEGCAAETIGRTEELTVRKAYPEVEKLLTSFKESNSSLGDFAPGMSIPRSYPMIIPFSLPMRETVSSQQESRLPVVVREFMKRKRSVLEDQDNDDMGEESIPTFKHAYPLSGSHNLFAFVGYTEGCWGESDDTLFSSVLMCRERKCSELKQEYPSIQEEGDLIVVDQGEERFIWNPKTNHVAILPSKGLYVDVHLQPLKEGGAIVHEYRFPVSGKEDNLIVATGKKYPPMFDFTGEEPEGFDVDLIKLLAQRMGKPGVTFVSSKSSRNEAKNGKVDVAIAAISITPARQDHHLFSIPYFETEQVIALLPENRSKVSELSDLRCGYHSPIYKSILSKKKCTMQSYPSTEEVFEAIRAKEIDFTVVEKQSVPADLWESNAINSDQYGIVFPDNSVMFKLVVDQLLLEMEADGSLSQLRKKYGIQ